MDKSKFTKLMTLLKPELLTDDQEDILIELLYGKANNKLRLVQYSQYLVQKYIKELDGTLHKAICELENAHPLSKDKLVGFLPYVRQHTQNGTNLKGSCQIFHDFFDKWIIDAKERLFDDIEWQERLGCKTFIENLKKLV